MQLIDLKGHQFGRLKVLDRAKNGQWGVTWKCRCICGTRTLVLGTSLRKKFKPTRSCGCWMRENRKCLAARMALNPPRTIHGHNSRTHRSLGYSSWATMIQRCTNQNSPAYHHYGGAGVKVCKKWLTFTGFYKDMKKRPDGTTLGRFGDVGDYKKSNCKWMTPAEQGAERRKKLEKQ